MSELRTDQSIDGRRYLMRVLTCFADADTTVVFCLGGNKDRYEIRTGRDRYDDHVPIADLIVDHYRSKGEFR